MNCPHCNNDITELIEKAVREYLSAAGSKRTAKKTAAQRSNMQKLNASYTPEKRKAAARKRLETLQQRKKEAEHKGQ